MRTEFSLPGRREGKVRDLYDLPSDFAPAPRGVLIIATDRISAFDVVLPTPIEGKGRLLTEVSRRWFDFIEQRDLARTHLVSSDADLLVGVGVPPITREQARSLRGRVQIARRCRVVPVECVARGYLDGSGWVEYQERGSVCGVSLPKGLRRGDRLPEPIFTPATKEAVGTHDENIDFERACRRAEEWGASTLGCGAGFGNRVMNRLRAMTLQIYAAAHEFAAARGLILADTKFEFGFPEGEPIDEPMLCDEALTPDSSRYWEAAKWSPGGEQASFDKQYLREYLNRLTSEGLWAKKPPGPALPYDVVAGTRSRYEEVAKRLFG